MRCFTHWAWAVSVVVGVAASGCSSSGDSQPTGPDPDTVQAEPNETSIAASEAVEAEPALQDTNEAAAGSETAVSESETGNETSPENNTTTPETESVAVGSNAEQTTTQNPTPTPPTTQNSTSTPPAETPATTKPKLHTATFGAGCFWCVEAVFEELKGVSKVESGYSGGRVPNPTYEQVCNGTTGHAEVIQLTYDPEQISFNKLLQVFFLTHDPTTLNRQGNDFGTQYRSAVFFHTEEQKKLAEQAKRQLNAANAFGRPVVTEVTKFDKFYPAEEYHQDFFEQNPTQRYCRATIPPKLKKVHKIFADFVKEDRKRKQRK